MTQLSVCRDGGGRGCGPTVRAGGVSPLSSSNTVSVGCLQGVPYAL